jgi:predicted Zn-dependent peptidase
MRLKLIKSMRVFLVMSLACHAIIEAKSAIPFDTLQTPKGIKILFFEQPTAATLSMMIGFKKSGTDYSPPQKQGLVSLISRLLQEKGNCLLPSQNSVLHFYDESFYKAVFPIRIASNHNQLHTILTVLAQCLRDPKVSSDNLQSLIKIQTAAAEKFLQSLQEPKNLALYTLMRQLFNPHPCSFPAGLPDDLATIDQNDIEDFFKNHFTQENLVISIAGAICPTDLIQIVDDTLGALPVKGTKAIPDIQRPTAAQYPKKYYSFRDIPYSVLALGQPWFDVFHPDYYAAQLLSLHLEWKIGEAFYKKFTEKNPSMHRYEATRSTADACPRYAYPSCLVHDR